MRKSTIIITLSICTVLIIASGGFIFISQRNAKNAKSLKEFEQKQLNLRQKVDQECSYERVNSGTLGDFPEEFIKMQREEKQAEDCQKARTELNDLRLE